MSAVGFAEHAIEFTETDGVAAVQAADLDNDGDGSLGVGDVDILSAAIAGGDQDPRFDVDDSGTVDVGDLNFFVSDDSKLNTWIGDSNLDLEFNSGDMVQVFVAGKYEKAENAGWEEGDWNADLKFDSGDMVAAFVAGGYEKGKKAVPVPAVSAVPEPTSLLLLSLGLLGLATRRRRSRG